MNSPGTALAIDQAPLMPQRRQVYIFTLVLSLIFFFSVFYFRNNLEDFTVPFTAVFLGIVIFAFVSGRFETYILLLLVTTSTVFELLEFPTIPIAIGDLYFSDLLIMLLLLGRLLKRVTVQVVIIPKPLGYAILGIICAAAFSFVYAIVGYHVQTTKAGVELRTVIHFSLFFVVFYYIRSHKQLKSLLTGIAILATIVAVLLIIQYTMGHQTTILGGRVEVLSTAGSDFADMTRVLIPGTGMILFSLNTLVAVYILKGLKRRGRSLILPAISLLLLGLVLTFTRSLWVAIAFSTGLILFFERRRVSMYPRVTMLVIGAVLGGLIFLQTKVLDPTVITEAVMSRTMSIMNARKNFREDTLYMRYLESRLAWDKITENPLLGIGLGNSYRANIFGNTSYEKVVRGTMVHNGYLATQLKMGLPGSIAIISIMILFFVRAHKRWRKIKEPLYRAVVLGIIVSMASILILNFAASTFLTVSWVAIMAVALGISEKIYQLEGLS